MCESSQDWNIPRTYVLGYRYMEVVRRTGWFFVLHRCKMKDTKTTRKNGDPRRGAPYTHLSCLYLCTSLGTNLDACLHVCVHTPAKYSAGSVDSICHFSQHLEMPCEIQLPLKISHISSHGTLVLLLSSLNICA
jgi:hypothetical protein